MAPDSGKLSITAEAIAASKLKPGPDVPATPPTLTADSPNIVLVGLLRHDSVVADVQDDVLHATISSALVAVSSPAPKPSPDTVTELPPLGAELPAAPEATAASKLYPSTSVPATLPTVNVDTYTLVTAALDKHPTAVADVHADVPHAASDSAAVAERS